MSSDMWLAAAGIFLSILTSAVLITWRIAKIDTHQRVALGEQTQVTSVLSTNIEHLSGSIKSLSQTVKELAATSLKHSERLTAVETTLRKAD